MVLRGDDPLALRDGLRLAELSDRRWFQFPQGTDPAGQSYWNGGAPREGAVVRGVQECLQAVLWNGTSAWPRSDTTCPRNWPWCR